MAAPKFLVRASLFASDYSKKRFFLWKTKKTSGSRQGVDHQHGNGHRADTARNRCDGSGNVDSF